MGYYQHQRRKPDAVFTLVPIKIKRDGKIITLTPEQQFSKKWMEKVEDSIPQKQVSETPKVTSEEATGDSEVI